GANHRRVATGCSQDSPEPGPQRESRGRLLYVVARLAQQERHTLARRRLHSQEYPVGQLEPPEMADRRGRAKGIGVPADEARDVLEGDFLELLLDAVEGEVSGVPRDDGHGERRAPPEGGAAARATRPDRPPA